MGFVIGELHILDNRHTAVMLLNRWCWFGLCSMALLIGEIGSAAGQVSELEAKAEFLFRLARFVDWDPEEAAKPFLIGILGDPSFSKTVQQVVKGRTIAGRPIQVVDASSFGGLKSAQVAFVPGSSRRHLSALMKECPRSGTLVLGESEAFLKAGGMISMVVTRLGKIRLTARSETLEASGLRISSKLLRILQH